MMMNIQRWSDVDQYGTGSNQIQHHQLHAQYQRQDHRSSAYHTTYQYQQQQVMNQAHQLQQDMIITTQPSMSHIKRSISQGIHINQVQSSYQLQDIGPAG